MAWPEAKENVIATRLEMQSYSEIASNIVHILTQIKDKDRKVKEVVVVKNVLEHGSNKVSKTTSMEPVRMTNKF